jgi:hypothetical protein
MKTSDTVGDIYTMIKNCYFSFLVLFERAISVHSYDLD